MHNNVSYSGLATKIKALQGRLISPGMYEEISSLSSVSEFVAYLKEKTPYRTELNHTDTGMLHRGEVERLLATGVYDDFKKIYRFANKEQRQYLNLYFKNFEIDILKKCLRNVLVPDNDGVFIPMADDFFLSHSKLDVNRLVHASSISELVELTKGTEYYKVLNTNREYHINELFDYELSLALYYYRTVWRTLTKKSSGLDATILIQNYGIRMDLLNLSWIHRGKFYFRLNNAQLLAILIPCNYKLKKEDIREFLNAGTVDEFNQLLTDTYYGRHYGIHDAGSLNDAYNFLTESASIKSSKAFPYSIACAYSYLIQKECERDRLTRALECIRYGLSQKKILEYINGGSFR